MASRLLPRGLPMSDDPTRRLGNDPLADLPVVEPPSAHTLGEVVANVSDKFGAALESAPALPRPLPRGYHYISAGALRDELEDIAPLVPVTPALSTTVREFQLLKLFYCKAREFAHAHTRSMTRNFLWAKLIGILTFLLAAIVALVSTSEEDSDEPADAGDGESSSLTALGIFAGVVATLVSAMTSWMAFAGYATRTSGHQAAADAFDEVAEDVLSMAAAIDAEKARALHGACSHLHTDWLTVISRDLPELVRKALKSIMSCACCLSAEKALERQREQKQARTSALAERARRRASLTGSMISGADGPNLTLQTLHRRAVELQIAHATRGYLNRSRDDTLAFWMLVLSTITGLLLFQGGSGFGRWLANLLATIATGLAAFARFMAFDSKATAHRRTSRRYAAIARDSRVVLVTGTRRQQRVAAQGLGSKMADAEDEAPRLPPAPVLWLLRDEKGRLLLPILTGGSGVVGEDDGAPGACFGLAPPLPTFRGDEHGSQPSASSLSSLASLASVLLGRLRRGDKGDKGDKGKDAEQGKGQNGVEEHGPKEEEAHKNEEEKHKKHKKHDHADHADHELGEGEDGEVAAAQQSGESRGGGALRRLRQRRAEDRERKAEEREPTRPSEFDDEALARLRKLHLRAQLAALGVRYAAAYEAMPPVPRRVRAKHAHIKLRALARDAKRVAPLGEAVVYTSSRSKRRVELLVGWWKRATDLAEAHAELAEENRVRLSRVQMLGLAIATCVATLLILDNHSAEIAAGVGGVGDAANSTAAGLADGAAVGREGAAREGRRLLAEAATVCAARALVPLAARAVAGVAGAAAGALSGQGAEGAEGWRRRLAELADEPSAPSARASNETLPPADADAPEPHKHHHQRADVVHSGLVVGLTGFGTAIVAALVTFGKLAGYEAKANEHLVASRDFASVSAEIEELLVALHAEATNLDPDADPTDVDESGSDAEALFRALDYVDGTPDPDEERDLSSAGPAARVSKRGGVAGLAEDLSLALSQDSQAFVVAVDVQPLPPQMALDRQIKMQRWYRLCGEYRIAHALLSSQLRRRSQSLGFNSLVLATLASVLLILKMNTPAGLLSTLVMALNAYVRYTNYAERSDLHEVSKREFATLQRLLLVLLRTASVQKQRDAFQRLVERIVAARNEMPALPDDIGRWKDDEGQPLFELITEKGRKREARGEGKAAAQAMSVSKPQPVDSDSDSDSSTDDEQEGGMLSRLKSGPAALLGRSGLR